MRVSRSEPGVVISSAAHAGLLVAALVLASDAKKFEDALETIPIEVVTNDAITQVTKGEKTARDPKPGPRVDKVSKESEAKPHPSLAEAKKDAPTPPPPLKRLPDPGADDKPEPIPPKRVAAPPPAPEPPQRPAPEKKPQPPKPVETEAKPAPTPPAKPKAAAPEEKPQEEPKEAEVVKPKPPVRPKPEKKPEPEKEVKETPKPAPEKPKETRLKTDEVAKLLDSKKAAEKPAKPQNSAEGETAEKSAKGAKPKSGDESAPKSRFDAASIANLLSKEAPQRRAATGKEIKTASLGAPEGAAPKLSASIEARIASYIHDHYHPCWVSGLSLGGETFAPVVEFHLSREGALEGRPRLLNPSGNPVEQARGEQALQAVRRCSPMRIPPEFMPYYEEALHDVTIRFRDAN